MKLKEIVKTSRSISIELENDSCVHAPFSYDVYVNGCLAIEHDNQNVISLYNLFPETKYRIEVKIQNDDAPLELTVKTKSESVRLNVRRFGAKGDGQHLDSINIQAAIEACPKDGSVYIPKGIYLCTPLFLKSNMTIELDQEAVLIGHTDRSLYPILPGYTMTTDESDEYYLGTWEGNPLDSYASLITGINVENVSIIGKGEFNGNGSEGDWWNEPKIKKGAWRPRTLFLNNCNNVIVHGITVKNSPAWTVHPYFSKNLKFIDMKIENPKDSPNTDGLDPESCENIEIIGVHFSVGDDCIAIKAGKLYMGRKMKTPSKNIIIRNCHMQHGHGAVVIGSEMSGGVQNLDVERCIFEKTDRGLRIKTRRGRGKQGRIDNISFRNIQMQEVLTPFVMNMFYFCDPDGKTEYVWSKEKLAVTEDTPYLGRFLFENIECNKSHVAAGFFAGLPEQPIERIEMRNISVNFCDEAIEDVPAMMSFCNPVSKQGVIAQYVSDLIMDNVTIEGNVGEKYILNHVDKVTK